MDEKKKKSAILDILRQMHFNGISIEDLREEMSRNPEFLPMKFDLLCLVNGVPRRLAYDKGKDLEPIGIFPFKGNWYLELFQSEGQLRADADENRLPDRDLWLEVYKIRDDLNAQLKIMKQPLLKGEYFARGGKLNWVVKFNGADEAMPENYYDDDTTAIIRYGGSLDDLTVI